MSSPLWRRVSCDRILGKNPTLIRNKTTSAMHSMDLKKHFEILAATFMASKKWHIVRNFLMLLHRCFVLQLGTTNAQKFGAHCGKLFRRVVGPPADIDWNEPWHTILHAGFKIWSAKYLCQCWKVTIAR